MKTNQAEFADGRRRRSFVLNNLVISSFHVKYTYCPLPIGVWGFLCYGAAASCYRSRVPFLRNRRQHRCFQECAPGSETYSQGGGQPQRTIVDSKYRKRFADRRPGGRPNAGFPPESISASCQRSH